MSLDTSKSIRQVTYNGVDIPLFGGGGGSKIYLHTCVFGHQYGETETKILIYSTNETEITNWSDHDPDLATVLKDSISIRDEIRSTMDSVTDCHCCIYYMYEMSGWYEGITIYKQTPSGNYATLSDMDIFLRDEVTEV